MQLRIISRNSKLAMAQAAVVRAQLTSYHPQLSIELIGTSTTGDKILDRPLARIGGKGLFIKELETSLLDNSADLAVHSMKDVPAELPAGLCIGAILTRADPRDVLIDLAARGLSGLPPAARIGTASLRRQAQLLALRSDLSIQSLRGNVLTRLNKLQDGAVDAIVLAAAGLQRLLLERSYPLQYLSVEQSLPAIGQGALGIECRVDDKRVMELVAPLHDHSTAACLQAERAMGKILDGGCQAPLAGYAVLNGRQLVLQGLVASTDGELILRAASTGSLSAADELGREVASALLAQGAAAVIQAAKLDDAEE